MFGFLKPFPFFGLPASSTEPPATGFGIGSVSVGNQMGKKRKALRILNLSEIISWRPWKSESLGACHHEMYEGAFRGPSHPYLKPIRAQRRGLQLTEVLFFFRI